MYNLKIRHFQDFHCTVIWETARLMIEGEMLYRCKDEDRK